MAKLIGKFSKDDTNYYFDYSTEDGTASPAMNLEEYRAHYRRQHGRLGLEKLAERLERADAKGTSSRQRRSLDEMVKGNHAGDDRAELSTEDLIDRLLAQRSVSPAAH